MLPILQQIFIDLLILTALTIVCKDDPGTITPERRRGFKYQLTLFFCLVISQTAMSTLLRIVVSSIDTSYSPMDMYFAIGYVLIFSISAIIALLIFSFAIWIGRLIK